VPAQAVNQGPKGAYVYLLGAGNKVSVQPVSVLTTQGVVAVIQSGLSPGQTVVTDGQMSLKDGSTVCGPGQCGAGGKQGGKGGKGGGAQRPA
jgi:membrane fusion protein, multidrug efflux system